jgi:hypothetical protein
MHRALVEVVLFIAELEAVREMDANTEKIKMFTSH